ncbi:MAG: hypothetical protein ABSC18_03685 [Verrucomicrobiota bacterium]
MAPIEKHGSAQRWRLASVEQIAAVSGFGGKTAEEWKKLPETHSPSGARQ